VSALVSARGPVEPALMWASRLGESPLWHPREQCLYWCDIPGRQLMRWEPDCGELRHWDLPSEPACCVPALSGGLLVARRDGVWHFDPSTGLSERCALPPYDAAEQRFNDGKCDPQGRFWIGTIHEPRDRPAAALYRLGPDGLTRQAGGITTSNGLAWSPDGRTLYWSDTKAHTVFALDFDGSSGGLSRQRVFARFEPRAEGAPLETYGGRPDGAAVDSLGRYWVAMFEGQRLLCLAPDGSIVEEIALPVRCPTMPCFGGSDLRTLYVTTAREHRPARELAEQPLAGCVLAMRVEVPGLPAHLATV
jgi:sugar lactone lactonase YvrE